MNLNNCNFAGRLTKNAELGTTKGGVSKSKFRLAVNDHYDDETLFVDVLLFGKKADNLNDMLLQGRLVGLTGKLKIGSYTDENDNKRDSVCIMANDITLGPKKGEATEDKS